MCRLLAIKSREEFFIKDYLEDFAITCKKSQEYQGDGWGCAFLESGKWRIHKEVNPIWESKFSLFGKTKLLIVHARSAFKNEGIKVENNMPFLDSNVVFIFNGELRGVRVKEKGRIGAEKVFNFIKRFNGNLLENISKATRILENKSDYVKAMNLIISDKEKIYVSSFFNEKPEYFTLCLLEDLDKKIICSDPLFPGNWKKIKNKSTIVVE